MPDVLSEFHFLRPIWLVGLLALPILIWLLHRLVARASAWRDVLDNDLASLYSSVVASAADFASPLLTAVWLLTVIALAGPLGKSATTHRGAGGRLGRHSRSHLEHVRHRHCA